MILRLDALRTLPLTRLPRPAGLTTIGRSRPHKYERLNSDYDDV